MVQSYAIAISEDVVHVALVEKADSAPALKMEVVQ